MARMDEMVTAITFKTVEQAKEAMGKMVAGLRQWELFGTMTYDPNRYPKERMWVTYEVPRAVPGDRAKKDFLGWVNDASGALGRPMEFVCGLEYQKNGWPHFHALLDLGGVRDGDIARIGPLWYDRYGYDRLEIPRSVGDCAAYAAKYLVKDISRGDVLFSREVAERTRPVQLPFPDEVLEPIRRRSAMH